MPLIKPLRGRLPRRTHILTRDCVVNYIANEGVGNLLNDLSGNGNTGTRYGTGTIWTSGKFGSAQAFNSVDDYIDVGDISELDSLSAFTLSIYANITRDGENPVISKFSDSDTRWHIWQSGIEASNEMYWNQTNGELSYGVSNLPSIGWHNYTMVFDGSQTGNANRLKGYIDSLQQTLTFTGTIPATTGDLGNLEIGKQESAYAGCVIDHVMIFKHAHSKAEVTQICRDPFIAYRKRRHGGR